MSFYLTLSMGVLVNLHYCKGKVNAVSLYSAVDTCEMYCGRHHSIVQKKCCSTSSVYLNIEDLHSSTASIEAPNLDDFSPAQTNSTLNYSFKIIEKNGIPDTRAGPFTEETALKKYIQHQSLLFYS